MSAWGEGEGGRLGRLQYIRKAGARAKTAGTSTRAETSRPWGSARGSGKGVLLILLLGLILEAFTRTCRNVGVHGEVVSAPWCVGEEAASTYREGR